MTSPLPILINKLDSPDQLDLDQIRQDLQIAAKAWTELQEQDTLYEFELRKELRAKVELAGGVPLCPAPEIAFTLHELDLLNARRAASEHFNSVFAMAPLCRSARSG
jgi:hypothetical protein